MDRRAFALDVGIAQAGSLAFNYRRQGVDARLVMMYPEAQESYVHLQGGWELDESCPEAAARETVEEAGVRGTLEVSLQHCMQTLCMAHSFSFNMSTIGQAITGATKSIAKQSLLLRISGTLGLTEESASVAHL